MRMFSNLVNGLYKSFENLPFDTLVCIVLISYAAIFVIAFLLCLFSKKFKRTDKRPFLCFTNAFAVLVAAVFLMKCELGQSLVASALFWLAGYVLYGLLCLVSAGKEVAGKETLSPSSLISGQSVSAPRGENFQSAPPPAPKNSVRLEHAVAVTDKLLTKNLSKADRAELEKLKNTLAVLQIKGTLTPGEAEILNENFNALLKLMAKYNV